MAVQRKPLYTRNVVARLLGIKTLTDQERNELERAGRRLESGLELTAQQMGVVDFIREKLRPSDR